MATLKPNFMADPNWQRELAEEQLRQQREISAERARRDAALRAEADQIHTVDGSASFLAWWVGEN